MFKGAKSGKPVSDKSFAIQTQHRPRRVAFLVDLGQDSVAEILLNILHFNLDSWGGRHNPIVPLISGAVPEAFYALLDVADPDVFYIYGELDPRCIETIHSRYSPTFVSRHFTRQPIDTHSYGVNLREQASIKNCLRNLRNKIGPYFRRQEPCILQLEMNESRTLSPFFLWNFGFTDSNYFAIQNDGVPGCRPISANDRDLLDLLVTQMNLVWAINVCGDAPLARGTGNSWSDHIPVFFGSSPWNIIGYWNDGLRSGPTSPVYGGINQLWLTQAVLDDEPAYQKLVRLLQLKVSPSNPQKGIKVISYDTNEAELERIGKKLAEDIRGTLHYRSCLKLEAPETELVEPRKVLTLFSPLGEIEYATGKEIHLSLRAPSDITVNSEDCWMVDLRIYNPEQELWYSNATPWWRLPQKASMAGLFNRFRPHRIVFDRRVSFEVNAKDSTLDFETPSSGKIFRHLLSPQVHIHLAADLRSNLRIPNTRDLRLSDKGRYLTGILGLSSTLRDSLYLFEHPFWRSLLQKLSRPDPSTQLVEKITSDARELIRNAWTTDREHLASQLKDEIIFVSKQLSQSGSWLTFRAIEQLYTNYLSGLMAEEQELQQRNLRTELSALIRDSIIFQGVELRCPKCISSYWYAIEDMDRAVVCRGCHASFPMEAEPVWSYQLNELIRVGIGDQGLLPVLRTLARLFDRANDSFFFTPSVDFLSYQHNDVPIVESELDLAWVKDGLFGIAEVKNGTKLFKPRDFINMAVLADKTRPDILLIAAPEGDNDDLVRGKKAIEEKLKYKCEVWAWGPEEFTMSPSWTQH
jgi:hypothetical protein